MQEFMQAGKFKAECLKVMDRVKKSRKRIIITKHRKPIAQIIPIEEEDVRLFGKLRGTVHVMGDLILPIDEEWNASH